MRSAFTQLPLTPVHAWKTDEGIAGLAEKFEGMPFKVLAFPDNQYFAQEPGTNPPRAVEPSRR